MIPHEPRTSSVPNTAFVQFAYAAEILLIATVACAKLSLALLVQSLMAEGYTLLGSRVLVAGIAAWAFSSIIAVAFRCSLPRPWEFTGNCINQVSDLLPLLSVGSNEHGYLGRPFQFNRRLQCNHRRSSDVTSLHSVFEGSSIPVKAVEDRCPLHGKNRVREPIHCVGPDSDMSQCLYSNCCPNVLLPDTQRLFR